MKRYGEEFKMNQNVMDTIAGYMDNEIREKVHNEIAPCTPEKFLMRYIELEPEFEDLLLSEFSIEVETVPVSVLDRAIEMDKFNNDLPNLEVGDIVKLSDIWDGEGEAPTESYSYQLNENDWINYCFTVINDDVEPLNRIVTITGIDLI